MTPKLTDEQREAIKHGQGPVPVEDELTRQVYFLIDETQLATLRQNADREAVRQGIADMEAGRLITLEELDARIRATIQRSSPA